MNAKFSWRCAICQYNLTCTICSAICMNFFYISIKLYTINFCFYNFYTSIACLHIESFCKAFACFSFHHSRIVRHCRYFSNQTTYCNFFDDQRFLTPAYCIDCCTNSGRTCPNNNIMHNLYLLISYFLSVSLLYRCLYIL